MPKTNAPGDDATDEQQFQRNLTELVRRAHDDGVDVEGGWTVGSSDGTRNWSVEIFEVVPRDGD